MPVDLSEAINRFASAVARQRRMTHAGIVIAGASLIEAHLERALTRTMQPLSKKLHERVFESPASPLGTFASKILIARALGVVSHQTFEQLETLRNLRNAFPHTEQVINLHSPKITPFLTAIQATGVSAIAPAQAFLLFITGIADQLDRYLEGLGKGSSAAP